MKLTKQQLVKIIKEELTETEVALSGLDAIPAYQRPFQGLKNTITTLLTETVPELEKIIKEDSNPEATQAARDILALLKSDDKRSGALDIMRRFAGA